MVLDPLAPILYFDHISDKGNERGGRWDSVPEHNFHQTMKLTIKSQVNQKADRGTEDKAFWCL